MFKDQFNIVIVQPPGFSFSAAFDDLAKLLKCSFESLGYHADIRLNAFARRHINIVLGYHMLTDLDGLRGIRWIPYQLEPLKVREDTLTPSCLTVLAQASKVWDYDAENIAYLQSKGIVSAYHVPIGYHPLMQTIVPVKSPDIDVLHYGVIPERRAKVFRSMWERFKLDGGRQNLNAIVTIFGAERDELISRSRIVLNIHQFDDAPLEQVRLSHLLNNGVCVVSEDAKRGPYADILPTVPYEGLADRCYELLADESARRQLAADIAGKFSRMPMTEILSGVLSPTG
jgi:hypothetical protein